MWVKISCWVVEGGRRGSHVNSVSASACPQVFRGPLLSEAGRLGVGLRDPTPVFVVGMPRSGSTLVETVRRGGG